MHTVLPPIVASLPVSFDRTLAVVLLSEVGNGWGCDTYWGTSIAARGDGYGAGTDDLIEPNGAFVGMASHPADVQFEERLWQAPDTV